MTASTTEQPSATTRRTQRILWCLVGLTLVAGSCAPGLGSGEGPNSAPRAILNPSTIRAGGSFTVAPPNDECLGNGDFTYLSAVVTLRSSGAVVTQGSQYISPGFSNYATPDPFVRLRIPSFAKRGRYSVYLTCFGYNDSFQYSPATLRVN